MRTVIIDNYDSFTYNLAHLVKELGADVDVLRNDKFRLEELEPYDKIILSPGPGIPAEAGLLPDVIRSYAGRKPMLGVCLGEQAIGEAFGGKLVNLSEVFHGVQTEIRIENERLRMRSEEERISDERVRMNNEEVEMRSEERRMRDEEFKMRSEEERMSDERLRMNNEEFGMRSEEEIPLEEDYIFRGLPDRILVGRYHSWVVDTKNFPDELAITAISPDGHIMALKHREYDIHGIQFHPESVLTPDGKAIVRNWLSK